MGKLDKDTVKRVVTLQYIISLVGTGETFSIPLVLLNAEVL